MDPEEQLYRELQRRADRLCGLIVSGDYPAVDVAIEARKLREFARRHFPGRMRLFGRIYAARIRRLWEQFRGGPGESLPEW